MICGLEFGIIDVVVLLMEGIIKVVFQGLKVKIFYVYVVLLFNWGIYVLYDFYIQEISQFENQIFVIFCEGLGFYLMVYVMVDQQGWFVDNLKFNVIGDVYGGLWVLQYNEVQCFLWEKYMIYFFVEQNKCCLIGVVVMLWFCFVVVVCEEVYEKYLEEFVRMCEIVFVCVCKLKDVCFIFELIFWWYNFWFYYVKEWLQ